MMKNLSIALNVILIMAVSFLFVKVFSGNDSKSTKKSNSLMDSAGTQINKSNAIAFVELDSLNEKISYMKDRRHELEDEQKAIETEWQNGYRGLENRKNDFLKRGNSITQEEAEKFQGELMKQQQQIDGKKQGLTQQLSEKSYKFMDDIQKKLKDFLIKYNKDNKYQYILTTGTGMDYMLYKDPSLNITDEVIKGMNEVMKVKK
jgi:outer membrane protein